MTLYRQLLARENENNPIRVGVIGAGQMGFGMISQIAAIPGMSIVGISDIHVEAAQKSRRCLQCHSNQKRKNSII